MTRRPVVIGRVCSNDIHSPCSGDCGKSPDPWRSLIRWQHPTAPAPSRCDGAGFEIEPQRAPGPCGSLRVRIDAGLEWWSQARS